MDRKFQQKTISANEIKEQQLLATFYAYTMSKYSMGNYNILLADGISFSQAMVVASFTATVTPTTDGATIKEDGTVSREKQKLVILDNKDNIVATGDEGTKEVTLTGIASGTDVAAGTYKVAYQDESDQLGGKVDLGSFRTLTTTTSTTTSTHAPTTTSTTTTTKNP